MKEYWHRVRQKLRKRAKKKEAKVRVKKLLGRQKACLEIIKLENIKLRKGKN